MVKHSNPYYYKNLFFIKHDKSVKDVSLKKMEELKKKLHTGDEGLINAFSICTGRKQFVDKWDIHVY